jgi:hypothetical protein
MSTYLSEDIINKLVFEEVAENERPTLYEGDVIRDTEGHYHLVGYLNIRGGVCNCCDMLYDIVVIARDMLGQLGVTK